MQDNNPQLNNDPNQQQPQITPPGFEPQPQVPQPNPAAGLPEQPQQPTVPTDASPQPQVQPNTFAQPQAPQVVQPTVVQPQQFTPQQPTVQQPMPVMPGAIVGGTDVPMQQQQPFQASMPAQMPQNGKSKKKLVLIIVAILTTLLLVGLGVFIFLASQLSPEDRFSKAINNMASINSVQLNSLQSGEGNEIKLEVGSDLSDLSNIKYKGTVTAKTTYFSIDLVSDALCVSNTECYISFSKASISGVEAYKLNTWGKFNPQEDSSFEVINGDIVLEGVIVGNVEGNAKDKIVTASNNKEIYSIKDYSDDNIDNTKVIKYNATVNKDKLFDLLKTVAEQYKLENPYPSKEDLPENVTIWVNPKNNFVVKYEFAESEFTQSMNYSNFNTPVDITAPSDSVNAEELVQY